MWSVSRTKPYECGVLTCLLRYFKLISFTETMMGNFLKDRAAIRKPDRRFILDYLPAH